MVIAQHCELYHMIENTPVLNSFIFTNVDIHDL